MNPRVIGLLMLVASGSALPACRAREASGTITVNGSSRLRQQPDRVSFSVGVETRAATVAEAYQANNAKLNAVLAALKQHGVQPAEMQTSNFSITSRDDEGKPLVGFRVSNLVTVTRTLPGDMSALIEAAVAAGANQAGSVRFFVADLKALQNRGMELAFQDARAKADKLASLSGRTLGDVVSIDEASAGAYLGGVAGTVTVAAESPGIEAGTQDLTFAVNITFNLK